MKGGGKGAPYKFTKTAVFVIEINNLNGSILYETFFDILGLILFSWIPKHSGSSCLPLEKHIYWMIYEGYGIIILNGLKKGA